VEKASPSRSGISVTPMPLGKDLREFIALLNSNEVEPAAISSSSYYQTLFS
jgi:hypothetical protein